eukprot:10490749-Prorocentrum_lima.AAC.1
MKVDEWVTQGNDREDISQLTWPSPLTLESIEIVETVWTAGKIHYMEETPYKAEYGNYKTNNRGDEAVIGPGG